MVDPPVEVAIETASTGRTPRGQEIGCGPHQRARRRSRGEHVGDRRPHLHHAEVLRRRLVGSGHDLRHALAGAQRDGEEVLRCTEPRDQLSSAAPQPAAGGSSSRELPLTRAHRLRMRLRAEEAAPLVLSRADRGQRRIGALRPDRQPPGRRVGDVAVVDVEEVEHPLHRHSRADEALGGRHLAGVQREDGQAAQHLGLSWSASGIARRASRRPSRSPSTGPCTVCSRFSRWSGEPVDRRVPASRLVISRQLPL